MAYPGEPYNYQITFADVDAESDLQLTAPKLPEWLSFSPITKTLSGTPPVSAPQGQWVSLELTDGSRDLQPCRSFKFGWRKPSGLSTPADVEAKRKSLIDYIWGKEGWPSGRRPDMVETNASDRLL